MQPLQRRWRPSCSVSAYLVQLRVDNKSMSCMYNTVSQKIIKLRGRPPQYAPAPANFDLLTFKVVSESRVTWATSVPILVFLGLSVFDLDPMYATDRRTYATCIIAFNASTLWGRGHKKVPLLSFPDHNFTNHEWWPILNSLLDSALNL